jgi:hypothetical protein
MEGLILQSKIADAIAEGHQEVGVVTHLTEGATMAACLGALRGKKILMVIGSTYYRNSGPLPCYFDAVVLICHVWLDPEEARAHEWVRHAFPDIVRITCVRSKNRPLDMSKATWAPTKKVAVQLPQTKIDTRVDCQPMTDRLRVLRLTHGVGQKH